MNNQGHNMKVFAFPAVRRALAIATYIKEADATTVQAANLSLYKECVSQVISDDTFDIHVLMMPTMAGANVVYTADEDEDMAQAVADLTGACVGDMDMIVVLGGDVLDSDIGEDRMLELALGDVASHLEKLWPVADATSGWTGKHVGWAAVAAVIAGAHSVIRMIEPDEAVMEQIQDKAHRGIVEHINQSSVNRDLAIRQQRPVMTAIEKICATSHATHGDYLSLPASAAEIVDAARTIYHDTINSMTRSTLSIV